MCPNCGGVTTSRSELRDHRAWCQGDALANVPLLEEVLARDVELTHEALVAEAGAEPSGRHVAEG